MDKGVFARWGVTPEQFDRAARELHDDDAILAWVAQRVPAAGRDAANRWLLEEKTENLDRQDREEGVVTA